MTPPKHYNPEPKFGLRVPLWRWTPDVNSFIGVVSYRNLSDPGSYRPITLPPGLLVEGDIIVYANGYGPPSSSEP